VYTCCLFDNWRFALKKKKGTCTFFMEIKLFDKGIEDFIKSLKKPTIAKVLRTLDLLEKLGSTLFFLSNLVRK